jgi:hypothetical protein
LNSKNKERKIKYIFPKSGNIKKTILEPVDAEEFYKAKIENNLKKITEFQEK